MRGLRTVLNKPEYFFRPAQLFRRLRRSSLPTDGRLRRMELPWGLDLDVRVDETIGMAVWRLGVYDLAVSEALWRLADPGERAADIGANVGHMSSLLAKRLGKGGALTSFEPLPELFAQLEANAGRWREASNVAEVRCERLALSDRNGKADLVLPSDFGNNSGVAYLKDTRDSQGAVRTVSVEVRKMDDFFSPDSVPQVLKVDVEGAEAQVFRGGEKCLRSGAIRDLVFEENSPPPTEATRFLEGLGFQLFRLEKTFFGPVLSKDLGASAPGPWEPPNFLATRQPERAASRFAPRGWKCLG